MSTLSFMRFACLTALFFALAAIAVAQGPSAGASTTSELQMSSNVVTAVQLNISTRGGATVMGNDATGLYTIDLGDVNGLGTGTPAAGVTVAVDATGALYKTPISVTPVYSGFTTETATIEVVQDAGGDVAMTREGSSAITASSTVSSVTPAPVASGAANGVAIERWVGMYVSRTEAAGTKDATLIYSVTIEL